jgi:hypothetical protein
MVKVWYEPPPYGPGTSLNRPAYGQQPGGAQLIQQLSRRPQGMLIAGAIVTFSAIAYIPISKFFHGIYFILLVVDDTAVVFGVEVMPTAQKKIGGFFQTKTS